MIAYQFIAVPRAIMRDIRLKPIDHAVVAVLISFAILYRDRCWCTVGCIASRVAGRAGASVSVRTVQRSIGRLIAAGHIARERVPLPDPEDARNRTGWRFRFLFAVDQAAEQVARMTPDILDAQIENEVQEKEEPLTLNGSAIAQEEDKEPTATEVAPPPSAPAPPAPAPAPLPSSIWTPAELASKLFNRLRDRGLILELTTNPDGTEAIRPRRLSEAVEPIQPDEVAELLHLRPHVIAFLRGSASPSTTSSPSTAQATSASPLPSTPSTPLGKPARAVPAATQARIRSMIGQLPNNQSRSIDDMIVRALADALGDNHSQSLELYAGLVADVRTKRLAVSFLIEAFESGCRRGIRNRGAAFVASLKASLRRASRHRIDSISCSHATPF
jgi:hypothetical protein